VLLLLFMNLGNFNMRESDLFVVFLVLLVNANDLAKLV
jgi:hypothetical protein